MIKERSPNNQIFFIPKKKKKNLIFINFLRETNRKSRKTVPLKSGISEHTNPVQGGVPKARN